MSIKLFITTRNLIGIILQILMSSLVWVCTMLSKTCLRKLLFSSRGPLKFKLKKSNGNSWLPLASEGWVSSTMPSRYTKIFMQRILIILIAWRASSRLGKSWTCLIINSVRSWWCLTGNNKLSKWWILNNSISTKDKTSMLEVMHSINRISTTYHRLSNSNLKLLTWATYRLPPRPERWLHQLSKRTTRKVGETPALYLTDKQIS